MEHCLGCGKDVCRNCVGGGEGCDYTHDVGVGGSGDGYFCSACDANAPKEWKKVLALYKKIRALGDERKYLFNEWDKRRETTARKLREAWEKGGCW